MLTQILEFGQTPRQLFTKPHPQRITPRLHNVSAGTSLSTTPSDLSPGQHASLGTSGAVPLVQYGHVDTNVHVHTQVFPVWSHLRIWPRRVRHLPGATWTNSRCSPVTRYTKSTSARVSVRVRLCCMCASVWSRCLIVPFRPVTGIAVTPNGLSVFTTSQGKGFPVPTLNNFFLFVVFTYLVVFCYRLNLKDVF